MLVDLHTETAGTVSTSSEQISILADGAPPVPSPTLKFVSIAALDRSIQIRATRHESVRKKYANDLLDGAKFEPIDVFQDPETGEMYRATGEYQIWAHELNEETHVWANLRIGTKRDAVEFAVKHDNGQPLSTPDKKQCVRLVLADPEWSILSNRLLGIRFALDHKTIKKVRSELGLPQPDQCVDKNGRTRRLPRRTKENPHLPRAGANSTAGTLAANDGPEMLESVSRPPLSSTGEIPHSAIPVTTPQHDNSHKAPSSVTAPKTTAQEAVKLLQSLLGTVDPELRQRVLDLVQQVASIDLEVDSETLLAMSLLHGLDALAKRPHLLKDRSLPPSPRHPPEGPATTRSVAREVPRKESLVDSMRRAIGSQTMDASQVLERLVAMKAVPFCREPLQYIRFNLSAEAQIFRRVEGKRGYYRLADDDPQRTAGIAENHQLDLFSAAS